MWFRRYWSVFVFTPLAFVLGFLYSATKNLHEPNHVLAAGRAMGSALFFAVVALVALVAYNRIRKIESKAKPELPKSN
jgi:hypothetical protein